jgi:hypothetical protein
LKLFFRSVKYLSLLSKAWVCYYLVLNIYLKLNLIELFLLLFW